jgi:hypothetical protein
LTPQAGEYEEYFYRAAARLRDDTLVRLIWEWDDARQRVRTRIPYADQVVYGERDGDGRLAAAMAINLSCPAALEVEAFCFTPPGDRASRCCEILNMMTTPHQRATARVTHGSFVCGFGFGDLVERGFEVTYSTCTRRRLRRMSVWAPASSRVPRSTARTGSSCTGRSATSLAKRGPPPASRTPLA